MSVVQTIMETIAKVLPDKEVDPTRTIVQLARGSRSSEVRRAFVPEPGSSAQVGVLYEAKIIEFAIEHWNLKRAARRSRSLRRARERLCALAGEWDRYVRNG